MSKRGPRPTPIAERFWRFVDRQDSGSCWKWKGSIGRGGYGVFVFWSPKKSITGAHRVSLKVHGKEIPDGMVVDHICRNRACVNPAHLRLVTPKQNSLENSNGVGALNARKTHCPKGHLLSGSNLKKQPLNGKPWRSCRICVSHQDAKYRFQRKMKKAIEREAGL